MADDAPKIVADVHTTVPAGAPPAPDLSRVAATNIQVLFRPALPGEVPNAEHAYIDITRANGAHQTIGAYPVGGTALTHEGGQLTFAAGQEKHQPTAAEFELHAPPGTSLTQYANMLVDGAKAYNGHALRYDGLGEDGVNSNAFVSSLIVAKGGATGLGDVWRIASVVDTSPVRTAGEAATMSDTQVAHLVGRDLISGRLAAPGFGNATIEPARFAHNASLAAATPTGIVAIGNLSAALRASMEALGDRIGVEIDEVRSAHRTLAPTAPPYIPGGSMHVRYAGEDREVGPGFRQSGTIVSVRDGIVTQSTGRSTAEYRMGDLTAAARDPAAMEKMLVPGRNVQVRVGREDVEVLSLERNHDLERVQRHDGARAGR